MEQPQENCSTQMIIPELLLYNTIESVLNYIRQDFSANADERKTWLYKMFNTTQIGNFNFYEQAKEVLLKEADDPRRLEVRLFFDSERAAMPTIHINLPEENTGEDGIGIDEGYAEPLFDRVEKTFTKTYTRRFDAMYHIIVTSDNPFEVVMLYHFLKAIMVAVFDHVQLSGMENPRLSGQDLNIYSDIVPTNVFIRGVGLSFSYDLSVPDAFSTDQVQKLIFTADNIISPYIKLDTNE